MFTELEAPDYLDVLRPEKYVPTYNEAWAIVALRSGLGVHLSDSYGSGGRPGPIAAFFCAPGLWNVSTPPIC